MRADAFLALASAAAVFLACLVWAYVARMFDMALS